jgi:hypothetical protein
MGYFNKNNPPPGQEKPLDEGHGAIHYNYYYGQNSNGLHSGEAAGTGSGGGNPSPKRREEVREMEAPEKRQADWAAKQQADRMHMRQGQYAAGAIQTQTFRPGQTIESQTRIALPEGWLPALTKGAVKDIDERGIHTVDFGANGGEQRFAHEVISAYFAPVRRDTMRESIRKALLNPPKINEHPEPGDRVVDARAHQFIVEKRDPMGRIVQVMDIYGQSHQCKSESIRKIEATEPLAPTPEGHTLNEGLQSLPLGAGQFVTVTGVDPVYNQWRTHGVPANEAAGFVGQRGLVEFAFYPVSSNTRMYQILFDRGGRRDFSEAELANPEG